MYFRENSDTAAELLKQAVPMMVKRKIPTNPCNFALWYAYAANRDQKLKEELESSFPESGNYAPEKSEELFFDYFVKSYMSEGESSQAAMVALLSSLFGSAQKTADGTRDYGEALKKGIDKIKTGKNPEEMERTLASLLVKTEAVDKITQQFSRELISAKEEIESLKRQLRDTQKSAFVDSLTKIGNRRCFDRTLSGILADPELQPSLLIIDIDHFKQFNDTYGHLTGDQILAGLGRLLENCKDEHIHVARYGGEEFVVIVTHGSIEEAQGLAESIRTRVATIRVKQQDQDIDQVSVSIGVAQLLPGESGDSLIGRADQALYKAKAKGRNQVQCAT